MIESDTDPAGGVGGATALRHGAAPGGDAPLEGLRVIDVSTYVAGPSGGMTLAQLGADVIRIDPVGGAADTRRLPLAPSGPSLYWAGLNKGKRSVEIALDQARGQELVRRLVTAPGAGGGILLTNMVGARWLDYEQLRAERPDVIVVHLTGRPDGKPAVDYTVNCELGLPWLTGPVDSALPVNHVLPAWDLLAGQHAALAILAAERMRSRRGTGRLIRIALSDVAVATMGHLGFLADLAVNGDQRHRDGNFLYGSFGCDFATADGRRVMVVALTARHWDKLVAMTGCGEAVAALAGALQANFDDEATRYRHREVLAALLGPWFAQRDLAAVAAELDRAKVLWGPYRTLSGLVEDPESILGSSDTVVEVEHPGLGALPTARLPLRWDGVAGPAPRRAPRVGEHTDAVLGDLLGLAPAELAELRAEGTIGGSGGS